MSFLSKWFKSESEPATPVQKMRVKVYYRKNLKLKKDAVAAQCVAAALGLNGAYAALVVHVSAVSDAEFGETVTQQEAKHAQYYIRRDFGTEEVPATNVAIAFYEAE